MKTLTLQINDAEADALQKMADRLGVEPERLLEASIGDLVARSDAEFDEALQRVLFKNCDLYRRLA